MIRSLLAAATLASLSISVAFAASAASAPAPTPAASSAVKKKPVASTSREKLKSEAKSKALAVTTVEKITAGQLTVAARVMVGVADCEFNQKVNVERMTEPEGVFKVTYNKVSYMMTPEETTTGAVRLEDKKAGTVWLQIPAKSMLLNSKTGHRLVTECQQSEQQAATKAADAAEAAASAASK